MNEGLKLCKYCNKEKPIKDFIKSGFSIKNICKECSNKRYKEIRENSKKYYQLQQENKQLKEQYCERTDCSGRLGNSKRVEELEQENLKLKKQLQQKEDIINKAKEFAKEHIFQFDGDKDFDALLEILDNKGE